MRVSLYIALAVGILTAFLMYGCNDSRVPHPNEVDSIDGQTYDILVTADASLAEIRAQVKAGNIPVNIKKYFDVSATGFNQAVDAWQLYRVVAGGGLAVGGAMSKSDAEQRLRNALADMKQKMESPVVDSATQSLNPETIKIIEQVAGLLSGILRLLDKDAPAGTIEAVLAIQSKARAALASVKGAPIDPSRFVMVGPLE